MVSAKNSVSPVKKMLVIDLALLVAFFLAWCAVDYLLVRSQGYPDNIHSADWAFAMIPVVTLASNLWITRHLSRSRAVLYSILGTFALCVVLVFAVLALGIPFHVMIGGQP